MSDVTAVILTIGEATTQRAIESVHSQSLKPCKIIIIENVSPFHVAMNQAIEKVKSDFFVEVDADMVLDKYCFAILRKCMEPQLGIVIGFLWDSLVQRVSGVKLYRKACFQQVKFKDSISPDTDVGKEIVALGWRRVRAQNFSSQKKHQWHTLGEHRPLYTPQYTYSKFLRKGKRYRYRRNVGGLKSLLGKIQKSHEQVAIIATVALSHGFF